jgi:hypothetical protein
MAMSFHGRKAGKRHNFRNEKASNNNLKIILEVEGLIALELFFQFEHDMAIARISGRLFDSPNIFGVWKMTNTHPNCEIYSW